MDEEEYDDSGEYSDMEDEENELVEEEFFHAQKGRGKKERRRRAREEAIYGIFGEEDEGEGYRGSGRAYMEPVAFVGAGRIDPALTTEEEENGGGHEEHVGIGAAHLSGSDGVDQQHGSESMPHGGLGFVSKENTQDGDYMEEAGVLPSSFGRKVRAAAAERRRKEQEEFGRHEKMEKRVQPAKIAGASQSKVGQFEVHTKGIGAKLLAKMGWKEGTGLGKEGKGLAAPLEAKMRPKGQGMGYGNRREPSLVPKEDNVEREEKKRDDKKQATEINVEMEAQEWRKARARSLLQKKKVFKTVEDVLADSKGAKSTVQTVIDMRGPHKRVVNDLEALEEQPVDAGPMPELQHNMRLLVDMTEAEIRKVDARVRHTKDSQELLSREERRLQEELHASQQEVQLLETALESALKVLQLSDSSANTAETRAAFNDTKAILGDQYLKYEFNVLALSVLEPKLKQKMLDWSPLSDPTSIVPELSDWKPILERDRVHEMVIPEQDVDIEKLFNSTDPYTRLLLELVLPRIRQDIQSWDAKNTLSLERFVEIWEKIMPSSMLLYIMQHLVLPKLKVAVQQWEPLKDPIAPHTWLHPWLPYLGDHMNELWPMIRFKFSSALDKWHPSDPSALEVLHPWKRVFQEHEWNQLCAKAIEPKLARVLDGLTINPRDQDMEPFEWVMAWASDISPDRMGKILDAHFFPKWRTVLRHWLSFQSPDFNEIARWYLSWKSCMPDDILETKLVQKHIIAALDDMNAAVSGETIKPTWTPAPPVNREDNAQAGVTKMKTADRRKLSLKDLVEQFAEESGVEFVPKPGRTHEGFQVYHFGRVSCIIDSAHEIIKAQMDAKNHADWRLVSLDDLSEENDRRLRMKR